METEIQPKSVRTDCYHCGGPCEAERLHFDKKNFCCQGCKLVYELLQGNDLGQYYELNRQPGATLNQKAKNFEYLDGPEVQKQLLEFSEGGVSVVSLFLPNIHCSSCIYLLENLHRIHQGVISVKVNFPKRMARISFYHEDLPLPKLAQLLDSIGYAPHITLSDTQKQPAFTDKSLLRKVGVAGFAFGNIMLMALPEYLNSTDESLLQFAPFFRVLSMLLAIPVVVYSGSGYFISAYKGLKNKYLNIDVPIALGIVALFARSAHEVFAQIGPGYFDSLTGLVFFLLIGKIFQQKTYDALSFERDYKSYFPVAVTRLSADGEENVPVDHLRAGDRIIIRNEELIPTDAVLEKGRAHIDNSFVTGESTPITKQPGDHIFAGGRQMGGAITLTVLKAVNQSYLTQLWNSDALGAERSRFKNLTDKLSVRFTILLLAFASISSLLWLRVDVAVAVNVFTAVLIVACPCALALAAPFTLGNSLRLFGKSGFFAKNGDTVEKLSQVTHIVFDKTGTLTQSRGNEARFVALSEMELPLEKIKGLARQSNHPLSRLVYESISGEAQQPDVFDEHTGRGTQGIFGGVEIRLGSAAFAGCGHSADTSDLETRVYLSVDSICLGYYKVENRYRQGLADLLTDLGGKYKLSLLSGDTEGERENLEKLFPEGSHLAFGQKPMDKLNYIKQLQERGETVIMVGDGLNDAGALRQSDVGISLSENVNTFSPACDAILAAQSFAHLPQFMDYGHDTARIIKQAFVLSFAYNIIGLSFAAAGLLAPIVCAILMPISSITVVLFATLATKRKFVKRALPVLGRVG